MRSLPSRHTHIAAALAALALALPGAVALAGPAAAATAPTVTLSVLVLDDGAPMVGAIAPDDVSGVIADHRIHGVALLHEQPTADGARLDATAAGGRAPQGPSNG